MASDRQHKDEVENQKEVWRTRVKVYIRAYTRQRHLFQEPKIKGSENQDDANVHHQPRPESVLKE